MLYLNSIMTDSSILELFKENKIVRVCAPMVRYSKLPFRTLVRRYGCDVCFTPMILADSFIKSARARENEFTTNESDRPLVVQFAANNGVDFATAAEMVAAYSDGVDLNCGCPQRWAMKEGYGADLLQKPELIKDIISQTWRRLPHSTHTVSVKLRLLDDARKMVELCRMLEAAQVSFLTIHARTPAQRHQPINLTVLNDIKASVGIPVIANGDVRTLDGGVHLQAVTGCDGVMSARGILTNPALFAGHSVTPLSCVQDWVDVACGTAGTTFQCLHHHLVFMLEKLLYRSERLVFNTLRTKEDVLQFLLDRFGIQPSGTWYETTDCEYEDQGSYFKQRLEESQNSEGIEDYLEDACDIYRC